jgi:type IV secretion system protein VirB10
MARSFAICLIFLVCMALGLWAQAPDAAGSPAYRATAIPAEGSGLRTYTVPAGTRILLSLKHEISTRVAKPGDVVYLVSDFPIVEAGVVVIPAGMYVKGTIDRVQRPGKVKGRAQLQMHLTSMIFPNGVEIAIPGPLDNVPGSTGAKVKNAEGTVEQAGTVGHDARTITATTAEGAGVGGLVGLGTGSVGMAAGIGAGAGAAAGVLTTLFTRGNDIVFPQGTTLEMVLARPVVVRQEQLAGMPGYTGMNMPAPASTAPRESPKTGPQPNN